MQRGKMLMKETLRSRKGRDIPAKSERLSQYYDAKVQPRNSYRLMFAATKED